MKLEIFFLLLKIFTNINIFENFILVVESEKVEKFEERELPGKKTKTCPYFDCCSVCRVKQEYICFFIISMTF